MKYKIKKANFLIKLFLKLHKYKGITMPWKTIYLLESDINNLNLISHELVHIEQIERDGAIKFALKNIWYNLTIGYEKNPYEIEARQKSGYR